MDKEYKEKVENEIQAILHYHPVVKDYVPTVLRNLYKNIPIRAIEFEEGGKATFTLDIPDDHTYIYDWSMSLGLGRLMTVVDNATDEEWYYVINDPDFDFIATMYKGFEGLNYNNDKLHIVLIGRTNSQWDNVIGAFESSYFDFVEAYYDRPYEIKYENLKYREQSYPIKTDNIISSEYDVSYRLTLDLGQFLESKRSITVIEPELYYELCNKADMSDVYSVFVDSSWSERLTGYNRVWLDTTQVMQLEEMENREFSLFENKYNELVHIRQITDEESPSVIVDYICRKIVGYKDKLSVDERIKEAVSRLPINPAYDGWYFGRPFEEELHIRPREK